MSETKLLPYTLWNVGDEEYKLKLNTATICKLENEFKTNLLNIIMGGNIPPLYIMMKVIHGAMLPYQHGIKESDVFTIFDQYCEEGGSQTSLLTDVFIPIYQVSGFFSRAQAEELKEQMDEARAQM